MDTKINYQNQINIAKDKFYNTKDKIVDNSKQIINNRHFHVIVVIFALLYATSIVDLSPSTAEFFDQVYVQALLIGLCTYYISKNPILSIVLAIFIVIIVSSWSRNNNYDKILKMLEEDDDNLDSNLSISGEPQLENFKDVKGDDLNLMDNEMINNYASISDEINNMNIYPSPSLDLSNLSSINASPVPSMDVSSELADAPPINTSMHPSIDVSDDLINVSSLPFDETLGVITEDDVLLDPIEKPVVKEKKKTEKQEVLGKEHLECETDPVTGVPLCIAYGSSDLMATNAVIFDDPIPSKDPMKN